MDRYQRQILLPFVGQPGQARLAAARVLLVGCGALGSVLAEQLARAGVGTLIVADRDVVEWTNLQRQGLFDENDAAQGAPKAAAAARRLAAVNSHVLVRPEIVDVHPGNVERLAGVERTARPAVGGSAVGGPAVGGPEKAVDLILDGTDNVATRYLLNDVAVKHGLPWVYGGCVGAEGRVMTIRPGQTPCLRCLFPNPPRPEALATCDTAGVLGPAAGAVASLQAVAAIKLLLGRADALAPGILSLDFWNNHFRPAAAHQAPREDCPCCGRRRFEFLDAGPAESTATLCGRNAVQVRPDRAPAIDLPAAAARWAAAGEVQQGPYFVRCALRDPQGILLTLFPDGRMIVQGTADVPRARSLYARFVGA